MKKNIVITGASRGIGRALIEILCKEHNILAITRNPKKITSRSVHTLEIDFLIDDDYNKLIPAIKTVFDNKVDAIINNAGLLYNKPFPELSDLDFLQIYKVNVLSVARITRLLLPSFNDNAHVVNISSMGGVQGSVKFAGLSAYSSSKSALITLTEVLAEEYKDHNISFNTLALGAVQTEMLAEAFPNFKAPLTPEEMAKYIADFTLNSHQYFNGKTIPVASTTP